MGKRKAAPKSQALIGIEALTKEYADARDVVAERLNKLHAHIAAVEQRHRRGIDYSVAAAREAKDLLEAAIKEHRSEFVKPRTYTFHGIKVGLRKLVGKITWTDAAAVVALIKKKFSADRQQLLIRVEESPVKDALERLSGAELKSIGCSVGEDTDIPVISSPKTDLQKFVDALLKTKNDQDEEA